MAEVAKLLYVVVVEEEGERKDKSCLSSSFRYTRSVLQSTLQLMGCKARHAFKISRRVFDVVRIKSTVGVLRPDGSKFCGSGSLLDEDVNSRVCDGLSLPGANEHLDKENEGAGIEVPFEMYKKSTTLVVSREHFLDIVCDALSLYKYVGPNQRADLLLACRIRERKESVTVLLCGTSGCGKSTLSALLGNRLGVTTVISTDSIRHMMRSFVDEKENPLLWASTYHAGECLDPVAVAKAKAKRKAHKLSTVLNSKVKEDATSQAESEKADPHSSDAAPVVEQISKKKMTIEGFKAQSEMVIDSLDRLITSWEERKESVVVEGVHLSLNFVMGLMKKHPSIIPFMVYITNEEKHMERFAVRAKYMTLDPAKNKYVKYIRNIRTIQDYLCNRADKHLVPKINNTNVDRSVAAIHATVFGCLRRREAGEQLYDPSTNTVSVVDEEYRNQCTASTLSSKGMFQLIQRKGSSRHLMALLNTDGSVAKAWPVESLGNKGKSSAGNGSDKNVGNPMYGPLQIGKAEPVNLQFGNYGISAWPSDTCGTSYAGSIDDSRADGSDSGSRHFSSCCSSPKILDGHAKELKEELSVSGSDEDADDPPDLESDDDLSDGEQKVIHEEVEGSVDEESTKSDEEYEDLAMRDGETNGYCSDDEDSAHEKKKNIERSLTNGVTEDKYDNNLELFLKMSKQVVDSCDNSFLSGSRKNYDLRARNKSLSDSLQFSSEVQSFATANQF